MAFEFKYLRKIKIPGLGTNPQNKKKGIRIINLNTLPKKVSNHEKFCESQNHPLKIGNVIEIF